MFKLAKLFETRRGLNARIEAIETRNRLLLLKIQDMRETAEYKRLHHAKLHEGFIATLAAMRELMRRRGVDIGGASAIKPKAVSPQWQTTMPVRLVPPAAPPIHHGAAPNLFDAMVGPSVSGDSMAGFGQDSIDG